MMGRYGFVIKKLTDRIVEYDAALVECAVKAGVDGISFRDDYGTPDGVRDLVKREFDTFQMMDGGSWFLVETDSGFPFANIEAQIETIAQWR